ncbi:MAG: glycosyltransferase family 4 protein [Herpetosiphon sp.]
MKLVYVAAGIHVPGSYGGATHTLEVARGLQSLGHEVHLVAHHPRRRITTLLRPSTELLDGIIIHYLDLPKALGWLAYPVLLLLLRRLRPHALIERYYNLAGAGVLAAARLHIPVLLEVNALIVDPPAVLKRRLDDRLGGPLRRYAELQCRLSRRIVTPLAATVPPSIERSRIVELPWGANVDSFQPVAAANDPALQRCLNLPPDAPVAVFLGSFRHWHGVQDFISAALKLIHAGSDLHFLLIGDGPERPSAEARTLAWSDRFHWAGNLPHAAVPPFLRRADVGVAPFNTRAHPALRAAGFYWSPLKIYEYMAVGLPVITTRIPPLDTIIRPGIEGALFDEGDTTGLAAAIAAVVTSPRRATMGTAARRRVEEHYSWQVHCRALERILTSMLLSPTP